jgi:hypothetical protein
MSTQEDEDPMLRLTRRLSRWLTLGKISPEEFADRLFQEFAADNRAPLDLAEQITALVPQEGSEVFTRRVEEALRPEFLRRPFLYGGAEPVSAEKLRKDAEEQTARVKAWAAEFRPLLDQQRPIAVYERAQVEPRE